MYPTCQEVFLGAVRFAGKERCVIETKSVDAHLVRPITNATHDHLANGTVRCIEQREALRMLRVKREVVGTLFFYPGRI